MSYDPNNCELGICGPCEACQAQMRDGLDYEPGDLPDPRGDFLELGDEIPEVTHMRRESPNAIGYDTAGQTAIANGGRKTPIGTIDCTPSWEAVVGIYLEIIGDPGKRGTQAVSDAKKEIMRAGKLADLYVKEHKR